MSNRVLELNSRIWSSSMSNQYRSDCWNSVCLTETKILHYHILDLAPLIGSDLIHLISISIQSIWSPYSTILYQTRSRLRSKRDKLINFRMLIKKNLVFAYLIPACMWHTHCVRMRPTIRWTIYRILKNKSYLDRLYHCSCWSQHYRIHPNNFVYLVWTYRSPVHPS